MARSRGSGSSAGYSCGTTRRPMNRRFVRSVRRATPDRPGAHRVNRSVTDGCSSTSGTGSRPSPIAVIGELARRPQQVLRPLPPRRCRFRRSRPGRTPPPAATPTTAATARYKRPPRLFRLHEASRAATFHRNILWKAAGPADLRRCVAWNQAPPSTRPCDRIAAEIAATAGLALPGTLTVRAYACGKPGCRCHADPPRLHGPYAEWTRKIGGKTVTRRLTPAELAEYQPLFDNAKKLRALLAELQDLTLEIIEAGSPRAAGPEPEHTAPENVG